MKEETATQVNLRQSRMNMVSHIMMRDPIYQAERIATHYLSHVVIAQQIRELIMHRNAGDDNTNIDACIARLVAEIKNNHIHDLGIELEWRVPTFR